MISKEEMSFAKDFLERVTAKLKIMAPQIGGNFPNTNAADGRWDPKGEFASISNWTTAFWPGMMWLMHIKTGEESFRSYAEECERKLDEAFDIFEGIHHDVGFMWNLSAVADYKLTGNERSRARALHAATILAGRFNHAGKFIRAWNYDHIGWSIIDSMMNIPLLHWASKETGDPRFMQIANMHADTIMQKFVRPDGSVYHTLVLDPENGDVLEARRGQGYAPESSWSRGQSWAIYGFAQAYLNTGKAEYLDTAKRVAHYFIANLEKGKLPLLDFRAPEEPVYYDASAASITTCGLLEIAKAVPEFEAPIYENAAMEMLHVLDKNCDYDEDTLVLLQNSSSAYIYVNAMHKPWIFGDYYLLEALMKLDGNDGRFTIHGY